MKKNVLFIFLLIMPLITTGQTTSVKWYSIEEAVKLAVETPRPIFVDVYTDWCGWCKTFDRETFSNPYIAEILNTKYYPVKFNAESKDPVVFQGRTFINDGKIGKNHQLAYALLQGKLGFPTVAFLTANSELITPLSGYKDARSFEPILIYFAGNDWQKISYDEFMKTFSGQVK